MKKLAGIFKNQQKIMKVRRGVVKKPAGKTVDGKELVIEEYPGLFGIAPFFGGAR